MKSPQAAALVFAVLAALPPALAQRPAPNANHGASAAAQAQEETTRQNRATRDRARDADARRCLEFPTNLQVIMCAEKYLPQRRHA